MKTLVRSKHPKSRSPERAHGRARQRGQSLVELALFLPVFLILIVGVAEMGFYLNHYINLLDATREGARFGADLDPMAGNYNPAFNHNSGSYSSGATYSCDTTQEFYTVVACYTEENMSEQFDPANGYDDIVISAFTVKDGAVLYRFPQDSAEKGFSYEGNQVSRFSNADVNNLVGSYTPKQGFLIVEIFWQHRQALALPIYTVFVPADIPMHIYTLMPNATAGTAE